MGTILLPFIASSIILINPVSADHPRWLGPFDLSAASSRITSLLENGTISFEKNAILFSQFPNGTLMSTNVSSPIIPPWVCDELCAAYYHSPSNSVQRLVNWIIPIMLLVTNVYYPEIGWKTYLAVFRLLGDPIDSMWSLLSILHTWKSYLSDSKQRRQSQDSHDQKVTHRYSESRERDVGVILAGLRCSNITSLSAYDEWFKGSNLNATQLDARIQTTATKIRECRTHGMLRASAAILLYFWQVVAAFVPEIGGDAQPSGGMIGPAMILSWLLPMVVLSNAIGGFSSSHAIRQILLKFLKKVGDNHHSTEFEKISETESLLWTGGTLFYQPDKFHSANLKDQITLFGLSTVPVLMAFGVAFAVLYTPPTYLTCRHFLILFILIAWFVSACITLAVSKVARRYSVKPKLTFYGILVKDITLTFLIIGLLMATSCDLFTSCWCLSAPWNVGVPRVYLNPANDYAANSGKYYPISVSVYFGALLVLVAAIMYGWNDFRRGIRIWRETKRVVGVSQSKEKLDRRYSV